MKKPTKKSLLMDALRQADGNPVTAFTILRNEGSIGTTIVYTFNPGNGAERMAHPIGAQERLCQGDLSKLARKFGAADGEANPTPVAEADPGDTDGAADGTLSDMAEAKANVAEGLRETATSERTKADEAREQADAADERLKDARQAVKEADDENFDERMKNAGEAQTEADDALVKADDAEAEADAAEAEADAAEAEAEEAEAEAKAEEEARRPNELARFLAECQRLREFVQERDNFDPFDSHRIELPGIDAIAHGAPVDALLDSLTASWGDETRQQAGISAYDFKDHGDAIEGSHAASPYVLALIAANVPVWLYGAAGTGKSTAARYAAEALGLDYYEVNLAGSLPSAVKGKDRLKEFVEAEFCKAYEHGGIMCLEEFDAAPAATAVAINNAIANGHFHNDANGTVIKRHENFRIVATANTLGLGATKEFQRNKIDGATLDRFKIGRVRIDRDPALSEYLIAQRIKANGLTLGGAA